MVKAPIESGDLKENLSEIDYKFVQDYKLNENSVEELLKRCHYLNLRKLQSVCICLITTTLYLSDEADSVTKKMK